ncbi:MAG TPA: bifunctional phosphopantothenoylcysteine decarboxylase/phosphopantothenate--cysteine ligase CoaBC [Gaiellales bacterium]
MDATDVTSVLARLDAARIECRVLGGWGVDALLGRQTRPHRDLDLGVAAPDVARVEVALAEYHRIDTGEWPRFLVLEDEAGRRVDLAIAVPGHAGAGATSTHGRIGGRAVRCAAVDHQLAHAAARDADALLSGIDVDGQAAQPEMLRRPHRDDDTTHMIVIGVCGGIAAYKTCELVRLLVRAGHEVQVVQTPDSLRFVGPTTFAALSRRPVVVDGGPEVFPHLDASSRAELLCIAPLSATTLSRIAHGEAANVLTATTLAYTGPIVAAPAMNPRMWSAAATTENLQLLAARGVELVGPGTGDTAEGEAGVGRMAEPAEIMEAIEARLRTGRSLAGVRVLVTAGGTREPLDAVRYIGNRSSGKMGVAIADEAARRGADVTLILAAASAEPSAPMRVLRAETAAALEQATLTAADAADIIVMTAAVSDYRPAEAYTGKRPKSGEPWHVTLEPTTDILKELGSRRTTGQVLVGFAAEHGPGGVQRARAKLERKSLDMIVMNDVSRTDIGFDSSLNELVLVTARDERTVSRRSKRACAVAVWDAISVPAAAASPARA